MLLFCILISFGVQKLWILHNSHYDKPINEKNQIIERYIFCKKFKIWLCGCGYDKQNDLIGFINAHIQIKRYLKDGF